MAVTLAGLIVAGVALDMIGGKPWQYIVGKAVVVSLGYGLAAAVFLWLKWTRRDPDMRT